MRSRFRAKLSNSVGISPSSCLAALFNRPVEMERNDQFATNDAADGHYTSLVTRNGNSNENTGKYFFIIGDFFIFYFYVVL